MLALVREMRLALRQLAKAPGFMATAVLTLAVGIGATTAIFTLVYDVLLRPLPFDHPERLVRIQEQVAELKDLYPVLPINANHFVMWQRNAKTIQAMTVMFEQSVPLGLGGHPLQVKMVSATPGFFGVFGVGPKLGRAFNEQEAVAGSRARGCADERPVADAIQRRSSDFGQDHPAERLRVHGDRGYAGGVPAAVCRRQLRCRLRSGEADRSADPDGLLKGPA